MGLKVWAAMAAAAIGGIYLTSDEGKKIRNDLQRKKSIFEPIIKNLLKEANAVLEGSKKINSEEIKANIELLLSEAKISLMDINLEKTIDTIKDAIKVASRKIKAASNQNIKHKVAVKNQKKSKN